MPAVKPEDRITESDKELHPMDFDKAWKGDRASYHAIHMWMRLHYPKTGRCEWCGCTDRPTEHAQARNDRITRNWADWLELCISCHRRFDNSIRNITMDEKTRQKISAARKGWTHCLRGHEFTPENTYIAPNEKRKCKECSRATKRKWRKRRAAQGLRVT